MNVHFCVHCNKDLSDLGPLRKARHLKKCLPEPSVDIVSWMDEMDPRMAAEALSDLDDPSNFPSFDYMPGATADEPWVVDDEE